ncbi:MAG TPA: carboxypeptidase regulatory-like domain-containing protein [Candidatus Acidoferrales bacterium]|nr:carboxypeptidase regulatory-like domain-containing protein [Candidatus Acidoferrales bacterium]
MVSRFVRFVALFALVCLPLAGQEAVQRNTVAGAAKAADGTPIPGAAVRVIHTEDGQTWLTYTDDSGKFGLRSLPVGHYRVEMTQLGFETVKQEFDLSAEKPGDVQVSMKVASLAEIAAAAAAEENPPAQKSEAANNPAQTNAATPEKPANAGAQPNAPTNAQANNNGARGGRGPNGQGGGGRGAFQRLNVQGMGGTGNEPPLQATEDESGLGQAAGADAGLIMSGSTAQAEGAGFNFGPGGDFGGGFGQQNGGVQNASQGGNFPGQPGQSEAGNIPGMAIGMAGAGGPGGPGGGGRGGPGGGGPGGGGRGGPGGGGRGGPGGREGARGGRNPNGNQNAWGLNRIIQQRINAIHYSLYDYFGDSAFNARPFSLTEQNPPKISTYTNRVGGNIGGPLRIPKIYDGRNRTFVFVNGEVARNQTPYDVFSTVPTLAERGGDFSAIPGIQLFDPTSNPNGVRTAFGSSIPGGRISATSQALLAFIPQPNLPGLVQNFHFQAISPSNTESINIHVLHTINSKLNVQANYNLRQSSSPILTAFPTLNGSTTTRGQGVTLGLTENFTPRLVHQSTFNWSRTHSQNSNQFTDVNNISGALGIGNASTDPLDFGIPQTTFTSYTGLSEPLASLRAQQTTRYQDSVAYSLPKHNIRVGGEITRLNWNTLSDQQPNGLFTFTGLETAQLQQDSTGAFSLVPGTGNAFADFLLGFPQSTSLRFSGETNYLRAWRFVAYATDDWHISPRFTLTYGMRYEGMTPPFELDGRLANLDVNSGFTSTAVVTPGVTAPFSGALGNGLVHGDYHDVAPRLGIAWRVPGKFFTGRRSMVVRSGYGIFYNSSVYGNLATSLLNQPPFATVDSESAGGKLLTFQNGFPQLTSSTLNLNTIAIDPNYRNGYAQVWNLGVETQVSPSWLVTFVYTGTKGTHLDLLRAPNRVLPGSTQTTGTISNASAFTYDTSGGDSILHSLQSRLQKRMHNGMMFQATYTYSKSIDDASSIGGGAKTVVMEDPLFFLERGLSSFDMRHQVTGTYLYELPFGERKKWARKGVSAAILGNWRINGTAQWHTGTPFTAIYQEAADFSGAGGGFSARANQIGDPNALPANGARTITEIFNTAAFGIPAAGTFGDAGRNTIEGPGFFTLGASLSRTIQLGRDGQHRLDFRWETTNVTNHPNFTGIDTTINSSTFGRVTGIGGMRTMDMVLRLNF